MPATVTSKLWYIRITAPHEHCENKVREVRRWVDHVGSMVGYHVGGKTGKPHIHIALKMSSELQKQSLDARLRKLFGVKGSGEYSSKVWDGDSKALSYMYHDEAGRVDDGFGLSAAEIADLQRMNSVVQEQVKIAKEKASYKVVEYVLEKIRESGSQWSAYEIGWCIQQAIFSGRFHEPGDYQMDRYITEILAKQCKNEEELRLMFADRMHRLKSLSLR